MDFGKTRLKWHGLFFAIALVVPLGPADCRQICGQEIEARQAATVRPAAPAVAPSKLAATAVETPTNPGVRPGDSLWSYWDGQRHPGQDWAQPNYDDTSWNQGVSPLGYGDDRVKTRVSFGDDPKQRRLVVFFRHAFQLDEVSDRKLPVWGASVSFDDGIAVYVNGAEVYRNNLPDAPLKMTTRSVKAIGGAEEKKTLALHDRCETLHEGQECHRRPSSPNKPYQQRSDIRLASGADVGCRWRWNSCGCQSAATCSSAATSQAGCHGASIVLACFGRRSAVRRSRRNGQNASRRCTRECKKLGSIRSTRSNDGRRYTREIGGAVQRQSGVVGPVESKWRHESVFRTRRCVRRLDAYRRFGAKRCGSLPRLTILKSRSCK